MSLTPRRPFYAYIVPYGESDPRNDIRCDAYGFEMNLDDEWPLDMILLTDSKYVDVFSTETGVTNEGTVFVGSTELQNSDDPKELAKLGTHVAVQIADELCAEKLEKSYAAGLNVILHFKTGGQMSADVLERIDPNRTILVLKGDNLTPTNAQDICGRIRTVVPEFESMRIGVYASPTQPEAVDYYSQPDVDGVFDPDTDFSNAVEVLPIIVASFAD